MRIRTMQRDFDLKSARVCANFVLMSASGRTTLAASCMTHTPKASWQVSLTRTLPSDKTRSTSFQIATLNTLRPCWYSVPALMTPTTLF